MKDLQNNLDFKVALAPVVVADNTVQTGIAIDTLGNVGVLFALLTGTLADVDATFAVKLQHTDTAGMGDAVDCAADDYIGTAALASFDFGADIKCRKIGYRGTKRYVRIVVTPTNNAGNAPLAAVAVLQPNRLPAANPPV